VWKYYGFLVRDGTTDKSKTICKICSANFKYRAGSTSGMSAVVLHSKDGKNFTRYEKQYWSRTVKNSGCCEE